VAVDAPSDGFVKAIGGLSEYFWDIVPLGNGVRHIGEGDHKSTMLGIWSKDSGVDKGSDNGLLEVSEVGERQAKLGQHGMQSARFEFVLGVANNG
jgi:hypothetical protein